ncbi:MAG: YceI family protein [Proteobacteria bacterium]|nr:YceI family protein [Pseudomonadota bacterium]
MKSVKTFISLLMTTAFALTALGANYNIDITHSSVNFSVKHLMISNVKGNFSKFNGSVQIDENRKLLTGVSAKVQASSIDTGNPKRDGHLKSGDFFEVAKYPEITFKSTNIKNLGGNQYEVQGDLTIRDTTKSVTLKGEMTGLIDAGKYFGGKKAGFIASTVIDRRDFGLTWNRSLEIGGVVVGNEVTITIEIESGATGN